MSELEFFCPTPTPEVQLNNFLYHASKLGNPAEMVRILLKLSLKQKILAVNHDFHWLLIATKLLTAKLHSRYVKESVSESEILKGRSWSRTSCFDPHPCRNQPST